MLSTQTQEKKKPADRCFQFGHSIEVKLYRLCSSKIKKKKKKKGLLKDKQMQISFYLEILSFTYTQF